MLVGKLFNVSCRHVLPSKRLPFLASLQTHGFCRYNSTKVCRLGLQTCFTKVCRLTFKSLPTNIQKVCRLAVQDYPTQILHTKKCKSAKSSLQSQVCKVKSTYFFQASLQCKSANFFEVCLQTLKKFADLIETVTDLHLQS